MESQEARIKRDIKRCHEIMAPWLASGATLKLMVECGRAGCYNWQRINGGTSLEFTKNCYLCKTKVLNLQNLTARSSL